MIKQLCPICSTALGGVEAADSPQKIAINPQSSLEKTFLRPEVVLQIVCIYGQPNLSPLNRSWPLPDCTAMPKQMLGDILLSQLQAASVPHVNPCKNGKFLSKAFSEWLDWAHLHPGTQNPGGTLSHIQAYLNKGWEETMQTSQDILMTQTSLATKLYWQLRLAP